MTSRELQHGIRENVAQFVHQLIQVLLVGFALGMMRTVVPAMAETEFGVRRGSFLLLTAFVVAFGVVKAAMNFVAGRMSEKVGRKRVLIWGWMVALPIPLMIWYAPTWNWIIAATILLGVNQGLCWSMTQTAKLDIARADQRGLTVGLNEFSGYIGVALAGIVTAYFAQTMGPRLGLLVFGLAAVVVALALTVLWVKDTLPWALAEAAARKTAAPECARRDRCRHEDGALKWICAPTPPFQEILTSRTGSTIARKQLPSRSKADFMPSVRSTQNQSRRGRAWPVSAPPSITNSLPVE